MTGSRVEFDSTASMHSASFAPLVEWNRGILSLLAGGNLTAFGNSQWAGQGWSSVSLLSRPLGGGPFRAEAVGAANGSVHSNAYRTAATRGELRVRVTGRHAGLWLGGAAATGWTSLSPPATAVGPTGGLWGRYGTSSLGVAFAPLRLEDSWFPEVNGRATAALGPADLILYAGWRGAPESSGLPSTTWAGASAAVWLTHRVALTVSGGSYSSDLLQALPSGRYLSAAIRISRHRPAVVNVRPLGPRTFERKRDTGTLTLRVPGARRVQLVGDWTGWRPIAMHRTDNDHWMLAVDLPSGMHRFNLIVDGEQWIVPPGVTTVDDGYGGRSGLLIVPE